MNSSRIANFNLAFWLAGALSLSPAALAADDSPAEAATTRTQTTTVAAPEADKKLSNDAIALLRAQLAAQQKQIEQLKQTLEAQQKMLDQTLNAGTSAAALEI